MIPGVDGIEVLKWIRKNNEVPVIMLTAKGDTFDKVLALELGADDYVVKPFEPKELMARVKAVMRRYNYDDRDTETINYTDLIIDAASYNVIYAGEEIKMPPKEFELLHYLATNKNKVFTFAILITRCLYVTVRTENRRKCRYYQGERIWGLSEEIKRDGVREGQSGESREECPFE